MSWSFSAVAKSKEGLKAHARKQFTQWHDKDSKSLAIMTKVADALDIMIDLFNLTPGMMLKLETNGHIDAGTGSGSNCKFDLTNYFGPLVE